MNVSGKNIKKNKKNTNRQQNIDIWHNIVFLETLKEPKSAIKITEKKKFFPAIFNKGWNTSFKQFSVLIIFF